MELIRAIMTAVAIGTLAAKADGVAPDYPIRPVPARQVRFADAFWWPRLEVNRTATIPVSFQMCEETGRIENFKVAAGLSDKKWTGMAGFNDSDVFKVMEGAAYSLMTRPDAKLAAFLTDLIGYVAAAQEDDGYLYTAWTARDRIAEPNPIVCCIPRDNKKWLSLRDSHELYNLGHMYEAAVAHWEATGDEAFLNVAKKSADLLIETFAPGKIEIPSGHPEIELALVKLYRATGDQRYLDLTK
ncbi:MAG: beta-L-arabinofuranosidase domain-containing protein, partial [Pirellulales bacterium]